MKDVWLHQSGSSMGSSKAARAHEIQDQGRQAVGSRLRADGFVCRLEASRLVRTTHGGMV